MTYPALRPSERSFTVGSRPITEGDWQGLTFDPRAWGDEPTNAVMRLEFRHIPEDDAAAFIDHYASTLSGFLSDTLHSDNLSGITEPRLLERLDCPWNYANPPQVEAVITGVVNLTVELIADFSPLVTELTT